MEDKIYKTILCKWELWLFLVKNNLTFDYHVILIEKCITNNNIIFNRMPLEL